MVRAETNCIQFRVLQATRQLGAFLASALSSNHSHAQPSAMQGNPEFQAGGLRQPMNPASTPFGNAFYGAGSGLIRGGLGAYGEKILGSGSEGHWTRITEPVGGRLSYKPPINDINAPDLYIPCMGFGTYLVLAGISLGISGKFTPEALNWQFVKGMVGWSSQVMLLKVSLLSLGGGEAPLLDMVAYAGYTFTGMCLAVLGRITLSYAYFLVILWTCLCMAIFLVKTLKRTLFAETRGYDSNKHHYLLLCIALAQFPLIFWLSNTSGHWLF